MQNKKFRCSSFGRLMTGAGATITDKQLQRLTELESKGSKSKELAELIIKRDAKPELSAGAKTYIEEEFFRDFYDYNFRFTNKYTRKGNEVEQESIRQVGTFLGYPFATKSTPEYLENDFICTSGYDWKVKGFVFDQKNVWNPSGLKLFDFDKDLSIYQWQIKGYAMLLNELKGEEIKAGAIIRTLMNPSKDEIQKQAKILWVEAGNNWSDEIDESFLKEVEKEFDFESKQPIQNRMRIHRVEITQEDFDLIKFYIGMAQEYYNGLFNKMKSVNISEMEFFKNK